MKTPQDSTLLAQTIISSIAFIALSVLIIYALIYHNTSIIPYALLGMATIYAHWTPSPAQQSLFTSLIQQITPILTSLAQPPTSDTTQPMKPVAPKEPTQQS